MNYNKSEDVDFPHKNKNQKIYSLPHDASWQYIGLILGAVYLIGIAFHLFSFYLIFNYSPSLADLIPLSFIVLGILPLLSLHWIHKLQIKSDQESWNIDDSRTDLIYTDSFKSYLFGNVIRVVSLIVLAIVAYDLFNNLDRYIEQNPKTIIGVLIGIILYQYSKMKKK